MEIRGFAQRLLFGETLADKLQAPGALTDARPGLPLAVPGGPGRPVALAIQAGAEPFPRERDLRDAGARGRALHFFANHELLAIELMALALLRFPDAPGAFRRALVATIRDEQRHLSLYLERMRELRVELGELALGGFFWRTLAPVEHPREFVAQMSLTFEQANLDHARRYAMLFDELGDPQTAALMRSVYEDEIRHVHLGATWMRKFEPDVDLLEAHRRALVAPISLRRARGRRFDRQGRERAGLPAAYIDAIEAMPAARGRAPSVHLFDPTGELTLAQGSDFTPDAALRRRIEDLEALPMIYASGDDIVLVRRAPRAAFLSTLRGAGFELPEFVVTDPARPVVDAEEIAAVVPWSWTPKTARQLAGLRARARDDPAPPGGWSPDVFSKARAVALGFTDDARVVTSMPGVEAAVQDLSPRTVVVKAIFGTAGRGMTRIVDGTMTAEQVGYVERVLQRQGAVVVEPWLDRVCDLSLRLHIDAPGSARILGVGRVIVDARGQYRAAVLGKPARGLPAEVARFIHEHAEPVWPRVAEAVATELAPTGYVGHVGVDAFVYRRGDGSLGLRPVVELNPRIHMGVVAHHLQRRIAPGHPAIWGLVSRRAIEESSLEAFADKLMAEHPLRMREGRIAAGAVPTNDPTRAAEVLSVLVVGAADLESSLSRLRLPPGRQPER